jgi:hypothetical protein
MSTLRAALARLSPLVVGTAVIACVAFAGSTSHVLRLAEANGQGGWLAWTIAGTVEALAVLSAMEIRHRVRHGMPRKAPTLVMVSTVLFLLAANVATASTTPWGYALAVVQPTVLLLALALIETRPTSRRNAKPAPARAARVVPAEARPVVGAAAPVDPQLSAPSLPNSAPRRETPALDGPKAPPVKELAERIANVCATEADVIPMARTILGELAEQKITVSPRSAERARTAARALLAERVTA